MAPQSVARGAPRSGDRATAGMPDRAKNCWVAYSPLRGCIFLRKTLLSPSRCDPERGPRGPAKRGSGSGGDARDRARILLGRLQPAAGSHLPLEETAQPFAVYSRRRLSRIPSCQAAVVPPKICSALPSGSPYPVFPLRHRYRGAFSKSSALLNRISAYAGIFILANRANFAVKSHPFRFQTPRAQNLWS
jgi:hypothetical protein